MLVQQLVERVNWGGAAATPDSAPNPRLLAYIQAATRRGATVRIMLDSFFDPGSNSQTAAYLKSAGPGWAGGGSSRRLGNPAGSGRAQ